MPDNCCPLCGHPWGEHEFGIPAPYCPALPEKVFVIGRGYVDKNPEAPNSPGLTNSNRGK